MTFANAEASSSTRADDFPLHLALSYILVRAYPQTPVHQTTFTYSHSFVSAILALVAREELELCDGPASFAQLSQELDAIVRPETEAIQRLNDKVRSRGQAINADREAAEQDENWMSTFAESFTNIPDGCSFIDYLEKEIRDRVNELGDDEMTETPHPIERRSPLGLFLRRVTTRLRKLSFSETGHLAVQVGRWCGHEVSRGVHSAAIGRRAAMENTGQTRQDAMDSINRATEAGDYTSALTSLRRFYDYQFPNTGRGRHQHALLNIASFHYSTDGLELAQRAIDEAVRVARAEGDKACLAACISLSNRIHAGLADPTSSSGRLIVENRPLMDPSLPLAHDPTEEMWTTQVALRKGEPTHIALRRVQLALARYEGTRPKTEDKHARGWVAEHAFDESAWHGSQAALWAMMGSKSLSEVHEDMAVGSEGQRKDVQLVHVMSRAQRSAGRGACDEALCNLLSFGISDGMSHVDYKRWSECVWTVLRQRIVLCGDDRAMEILDALQRPHGDNLSDTPRGSVADEIRRSLKEAEKLRVANTPHLVMPRILSSLHLARDLGLWPLYRLAVVIFAETLLVMEDQGMARTAIKEVENIWPELAGSGDEATTARAALLLGKALISISLDEDHPDLLAHAMDHLRTARQSAQRVSAQGPLQEVRQLIEGVTALRGGRWTDDGWGSGGQSIDVPDLAETVRSVGEIVKLTGVRVCESWR